MPIVTMVRDLQALTSHVDRDKGDDWWFMMLAEEIGELAGALRDQHEDPPEWELMQIASIALNWLEKRGATALCRDLLFQHRERMENQ